MKTTTLILILIFFLQGCSEKNTNSELLGHWISTKSANVVELQFYKDSLIYNTWEKTTKFRWKSDGTIIYYTQLTNIDPELETDFTMEYRLNLENDTLFLKNSDSEFTNEFIKTKGQQNK